MPEILHDPRDNRIREFGHGLAHQEVHTLRRGFRPAPDLGRGLRQLHHLGQRPGAILVADWLGGFVGADVNDSNWRLFQVITEEFLASVGAPHSRAEIDAGLARLEDWYRGGGWYTDGDGRKFDYYNGWALHLYPVLWARIAGPRADPAAVARHRARLSYGAAAQR